GCNPRFIIECPILFRGRTLETKATPPSPPIVLRDETSLPRQTPITVLALGGNAIIRRNQEGTFEEQYENVKSTTTQIATLVNDGLRIGIVHGNGTQIGATVIRLEIARPTAPP